MNSINFPKIKWDFRCCLLFVAWLCSMVNGFGASMAGVNGKLRKIAWIWNSLTGPTTSSPQSEQRRQIERKNFFPWLNFRWETWRWRRNRTFFAGTPFDWRGGERWGWRGAEREAQMRRQKSICFLAKTRDPDQHRNGVGFCHRAQIPSPTQCQHTQCRIVVEHRNFV